MRERTVPRGLASMGLAEREKERERGPISHPIGTQLTNPTEKWCVSPNQRRRQSPPQDAVVEVMATHQSQLTHAVPQSGEYPTPE